MGAVFELVNTYGTGNATALTLNHVWDPQNVQAIRANLDSPPARIVAAWAATTASADVTIHSPRMHDDIQALQFRTVLTSTDLLGLEGLSQPMYSQDAPIVQSTFATAPATGAAQNFDYLVYYPNLGGANQRLVTWAAIQPLIQSYLGIKIAATSGTVAGQFGAPALLNSVQDLTKANSWYAILGYQVASSGTAIAIQGPDTSNYIYGGPGTTNLTTIRRWFYFLDKVCGVPAIPVINSANKGATSVVVAANTASAAQTVTLFCAWLGPVASNPNLGQ